MKWWFILKKGVVKRMMIDSRESYYIAKCDNKVNSTCKFSEGEYKDWNGKCCYGKDGGIYCTSNFELIRATVEELAGGKDNDD